jgi:hypothetical protein
MDWNGRLRTWYIVGWLNCISLSGLCLLCFCLQFLFLVIVFVLMRLFL